MTKPTDAEIKDLYAEQTGFILDDSPAALLDFARAVLARWGQPAHSGEPVAWRIHPFDYGIGSQGVYAITSLPQQRDAWLRRGWKAEPLYTTPQPTQPQAGVVPLTDGQIAEMMRETWGCASIAPRHALEFARAVERAHGIEGGQHVGNVD